uniref:Ig-like domain-containing protein n=1 Tax=Pygocentrus nattereri TaxID=42514 RepID=A0AAR2KWM0_PYGNA
MLLTFYLLFIGLHVSEGCDLVNREQLLSITAHTGGSVLLPCYCPDLQTTPEEFRWTKDDTKTGKRENISSQSGQYSNRVQLVNGHSPGNLSLLISHLTEEDGGDYMCAVKGAHLIIRLALKGKTLSVFILTAFQIFKNDPDPLYAAAAFVIIDIASSVLPFFMSYTNGQTSFAAVFVLLSGVDQRRMSSPFRSSFLLRFLPLTLEECFPTASSWGAGLEFIFFFFCKAAL